jgi:hypothetical protein
MAANVSQLPEGGDFGTQNCQLTMKLRLNKKENEKY